MSTGRKRHNRITHNTQNSNRAKVMLIMHTSLRACTLVEGPLAEVPIARILGHILGYNVAAVAGMSGLAA